MKSRIHFFFALLFVLLISVAGCSLFQILGFVPPDTPTGLAVSNPKTTSLDISWDSAPGADSYQLYRAADSSGPWTAQVYSNTGNGFTDKNLASGTTYYYAVRATNPAGSSALSSPASGTTATPTTASQQIGAGGGALSVLNSDGSTAISIVVPQDAVAADTQFQITQTKVDDSSLGDLFSLEPENTRFAKPITVTLDYAQFAAKSQLLADDICLYQISNGYLVPVEGALLNTDTKTIDYSMYHFCGVTEGARQPTATMIQHMQQVSGATITQQYIAMCNQLYNLYTGANTNYLDRASFGSGFSAVKGWCDARTELQAGTWIENTVPSWWADKIVAGYELIVWSNAADFSKTPTLETTYAERCYGNDMCGEKIPIDMGFIAMPGQIRETADTKKKVSTLECFDIYIHKTLSNPRLSVNQSDLIYLEEGGIQSIEATLDYQYYVHGVDVDNVSAVETDPFWQYAPVKNTTISFSVESGSGTLSSTSATTGSTGRAQNSYTAKWDTTDIEPETATVRVTMTHGDLKLTKDVTITEKASGPIKVSSVSPASGSTNVAVTAPVVVTFDRNPDPQATGTIVIGDVSLVSGITCTMSAVGKVLTATPNANWEYDTTYTGISITGFKGADGLDAEDYTDTAYNFKTQKQGMKVVSVTPATSSVNVAVTTPLVVTFDDDPDPLVTGTIVISSVSGGSGVNLTNSSNCQMSITDKVLTVVLNNDWLYNKTYTGISITGFKNIDGANAEDYADTQYTFTTVNPALAISWTWDSYSDYGHEFSGTESYTYGNSATISEPSAYAGSTYTECLAYNNAGKYFDLSLYDTKKGSNLHGWATWLFYAGSYVSTTSPSDILINCTHYEPVGGIITGNFTAYYLEWNQDASIYYEAQGTFIVRRIATDVW